MRIRGKLFLIGGMPNPIFDFGNIFPDFCDIILMFDKQVIHLLEERSACIAELRKDGDRCFDEVETVDLVLNTHIERGRDGAFFCVTENVQIFIVARISQLVDQRGITVEIKDDGLVFCEDRVVIRVGQAVRVNAVRL